MHENEIWLFGTHLLLLFILHLRFIVSVGDSVIDFCGDGGIDETYMGLQEGHNQHNSSE